MVADRFFASYLKDARTEVNVFDLAGKSRPRGRVPRPGDGLRDSWQAARAGDLLLLRLVHGAGDRLPLRRRDREEPSSASPRSASSPPTYDDRAGLLPEQGRNADSR